MNARGISGIMLTLLLTSMLALTFSIQPVEAEPKTWYVDDDGGADFTRIQDAINAASPGDTIYVYNGVYFENLIVRKDSLTFIGESKSDTVIDGGGDVVISIYRNKVSVSGFTVRNGGWDWYIIWGSAILLDYAQYCNISDNIVSSSRRGIASYHGRHNNISGNTIFGTNQGVTLYYTLNETVTDNAMSNGVHYETDPPYGVQLWGGYDNRVMGNTITEISYVGISLGEYARNNVIQDNTISDAEAGVRLYQSLNNTVSSNIISNSSIFISDQSDNNIIIENLVSNSDYGILIFSSNNTQVYHNNFIDNTWQVVTDGSINTWDDGYPSGGNYWSDYTDRDLYCGPNQNMWSSDGIWDHPYVIDADNKDNYPLKKPFSPGNLSVSISTDKYTYHAGDKMYVGLNAENPDSVKYLCFAMWVTLPDNSIYLYMHEHSVILPIGLSYTSSPFAFFTLPTLPPGTYTWHAAFLERSTHTIIIEDTAGWDFI